eukprot:scaffold356978_cov25-Prasinocladus_malaysianus.AAC.1
MRSSPLHIMGFNPTQNGSDPRPLQLNRVCPIEHGNARKAAGRGLSSRSLRLRILVCAMDRFHWAHGNFQEEWNDRNRSGLFVGPALAIGLLLFWTALAGEDDGLSAK